MIRIKNYEEAEKNYGLENHTVRCIDGQVTGSENCVGFCRFNESSGFMTEELVKMHDCVARKCCMYIAKVSNQNAEAGNKPLEAFLKKMDKMKPVISKNIIEIVYGTKIDPEKINDKDQLVKDVEAALESLGDENMAKVVRYCVGMRFSRDKALEVMNSENPGAEPLTLNDVGELLLKGVRALRNPGCSMKLEAYLPRIEEDELK